jgi:TRAP-type transport system large permease protein
VVIVASVMIGLHTSPYGMLRFAIDNRLTGLSRRDMIAEIWPFRAMLMAALLVLVRAPEAVLGLPRPFGRGG